MTQVLSHYHDLLSGFSHLPAMPCSHSCREQAFFTNQACWDSRVETQTSKPSSLSGKTTRGNSPKSHEKRTKLVNKDTPFIYSEGFFSEHQNPNNHILPNIQNQGEKTLTNSRHPTHNVQKSRLGGHNYRTGPSKGAQLEKISENSQVEDTLKYKTELCRNFELTGRCKFGPKCSYAHGKDQLVTKKHINLHYKSKKCNKYFENGFCEYGSRCQYLHKEDSYTHILDSYCEKLLVWIERNPQLDMSSIMKKTHTFGNRNSFFLKLEQSASLQTDEPTESQ